MSAPAVLADEARASRDLPAAAAPLDRRGEEEEEGEGEAEVTFRAVGGAEGAALDRLFGVQGCLLEANPGRVLLPPDFQRLGLGPRIRRLRPRPCDTWLVSYPRTGSTWAQEMVWCIGNNLDYEGAKQMQQLRSPLLELSGLLAHDHEEWMERLGNSVDLVESLPSPRFIKTHLPWELLPIDLKNVRPKIVYVARNPKDMCVSYYHYCKLVHNLKGSFEEFCELFLKDRAPVGPIWNHILGFWKRRHQPNILFLTYEEMKRDQEGIIRKTAKFMGKEISDEEVKQLAEYLSFNNMRKNPAVNLKPVIEKKMGPDFMEKNQMFFIRKGEVGDWKNYMSPELAARFDAWTEENLKGTGLTF